MKIRVISSIAALALLVVIMFLGSVALGIVVFMLAIIGVNEFYNAMESGGYKPIKIIGYLSCLSLLYLVIDKSSLSLSAMRDYNLQLIIISLLVFLILILVFCFLIFKHEEYDIPDAAVTILGILYVVFLFSFVILVRNMDGRGEFYIWFVFIGSWVPDTAAYFTGVTIGKTKILPIVSPKKSLEGSIGGVVGCICVMTGVGLFFNTSGIFGVDGIPVYHYIILGAICGIISQIGDWSASAIKRYVGIKDYGWLMPGHGGVLDRFDSILFVAPAVYFYLSLCF